MEILTSVTELLILVAIGSAILQNLSDSGNPTPQENLIPIPVEDKKPPVIR